jgi:hypothetical protein
VGSGASVCKNAQIAFNSVSFISAKARGITKLVDDPSGLVPVRITARKSFSVHLLNFPEPCGVKFAAGGQSGGPISIFPPEKLLE